MTRAVLRCGLIGANISRTRFPAALDLMCADAGLRLEFDLIDTAGNAGFDLAATVRDLRQRGWNGVAVTHPWKSAAAALPGADDSGLGAVNTLIFSENGLRGANTDFTGFLSAWAHNMGCSAPGRVAMAGAGGVARALVPALARLGAADIAVWDTDPARARDLAAAAGFPCRAIPEPDAAAAMAAADGLVNATACGMADYPRSAFPDPLPARPAWAFDAVYTPADTVFLTDAARLGARVLSGFALFQHMALRSFEALTGIVPDPAATLPKLAALGPREENGNV